MSSSDEFCIDKLCIDEINQMFPTKALYETHYFQPKTRVEMRMIKASALIRSAPEWAEQLNDESKRQEWTTQVKDDLKLTDMEVVYVFRELKYYARLKANGVDGEELAAIDGVWINNATSDSDLADEFKNNAAVLENDFAQVHSGEASAASSTGFRALVDPFMYPLMTKESLILTKPVGSPEDALNPELPRVKPEYLKDWHETINDINEHKVNNGYIGGKRKPPSVIRQYLSGLLNEFYGCWLPTDFDVGEDGTVTIRSYINNLHPTRYAALYQTISKVFAKLMPLLEQVATDMIHPRASRAVFDRDVCCAPGMFKPYKIVDMVRQGVPLPEEYHKFVANSDAYAYERSWHDINIVKGVELDMTELENAYKEAEVYTEPAPQHFCPSNRPIKPYSMRGLPLQASVEMSSINLTPENPTHPEGEWQAVGRAEERVFAVGLYFYDVENIASPKLKFRDPVSRSLFYDPNDFYDFCASHDIVSVLDPYHSCVYTQEVGEVEIKNGSYVCYPNYYQTKMPLFELADPTRPGHVKYIAFNIVDPMFRLISTELVPPQQPDWTDATSSLEATAEAIKNMERLKYSHFRSSRDESRFRPKLCTGDY
ncbi:hypothetical protein GGH93_000192 [Coemansia aciculifera]|nr:hypothetical protein GGH93_000192 [Coemansia aciculifera]